MEGSHIMRQSYTCIFKRTLSSRVWVLPTAHRCVWLWLKLAADPEGFVCADVAGVAYGAHVTGAEAREALEVLAMADADADPEDPNEGRIIERVRGGWRVLGCEQDRELAKLETKRARTRQYMRNNRARVANDVTPPNHSDPVTVTVAPPIPTPKPIPKPREAGGESPLPPAGGSAAPAASHIEVSKGLFVSRETLEQSLPELKAPPSRHVAPGSTIEPAHGSRPVWYTLDDWEPPPELLSEATIVGLSKEDFDSRLAQLRTGPIGGTRGVLDRTAYVRAQLGKWKAWGETDRAKARAAAAAPPSSRSRFVTPAPEPKAKHLRVAKRFGIDLGPIIAHLAETKIAETLGTDGWHEHLEKAIARECKRKTAGEAA